MGIRAQKIAIRRLLAADDFPSALAAFDQMAERQAVNPLLSFFYDTDPRIRWHAITAFGRVLARLAHRDMESARVVMRRLMWNLNDESGGIGWGSPEAMGESMARHSGLARQYAHMLISYINPRGNFLEHTALQCGVLWGLGRLAVTRPENAGAAIPFLHPFLESQEPLHRGLAAWSLGTLRDASATPFLKALATDTGSVVIYRDLQLQHQTVSELAREALATIPGP